MLISPAWLAAVATVAILLSYEVALAVRQRRSPQRMAKTAHAILRREWFEAVAAEKGTEILAVQAVRNAMMSATMTSSIAALGLMGTVTLALPSLHESLGDKMALAGFSPRLLLGLVLLALLFASLVSSVMAVRFYNHCGFICAMPVGSHARKRWHALGAGYIQRAGMLYSWGVKHLILVAPILASLLQPYAGPVAALLVVAALLGFDGLKIRIE
ncbi:DUF599 domain-containing protein [Pseudoduganella aquatica]|uniref:DUF599 family protein n=1 Tax=Pseudoduganella aquatica TaxID=2660641 RepID=A0A7X4HDH3_9BURK|nr:DUF599 domain-containing protein [Pseudoduganella aquatica]MYN08768.1 DUF599 family protein [Pseudoduganella aquatica]